MPGFRTGDPSDPFQPVEIPLYLGLITVIYLLGVLIGDERRPRWLRSVVSAGADYSYGIYLSQVLFLTALTWLGWGSLSHHAPWVVVTLGGIVIVFIGSGLLTALLARLPGARATAGIPRRPWQRSRPAGPDSAEPDSAEPDSLRTADSPAAADTQVAIRPRGTARGPDPAAAPQPPWSPSLVGARVATAGPPAGIVRNGDCDDAA